MLTISDMIIMVDRHCGGPGTSLESHLSVILDTAVLVTLSPGLQEGRCPLPGQAVHFSLRLSGKLREKLMTIARKIKALSEKPSGSRCSWVSGITGCHDKASMAISWPSCAEGPQEQGNRRE